LKSRWTELHAGCKHGLVSASRKRPHDWRMPTSNDIRSAIRKEYVARSEIFNASPFRKALVRRGPVAARKGAGDAEVAGW
jgi:hypothetical protein